jgi:hypothetical protein
VRKAGQAGNDGGGRGTHGNAFVVSP